MKTLIKSLAVALTLGIVTSAASFAHTNPGTRPTTAAAYKTGIYSTPNGQLNIALDKEKGGAVDVRLKGADGKVLYTQHVGKNERNYRVRLNLSELADGVYQVEVSNGVETTTQTVTISTNQPSAPSRLISIN
ncbi:T9SS type A sorting domain-containing protein [Spirosoma sp. HMF4905]|uniref:T9SS type A sorting domain-containing protein n=1 Tax=Spirosoma arboris TaxID=2682092 RepID=A0A7K1SGZ7_9BACT|nr:T9SS type A sorting domain-containing protein [Spirosoma arboris]MVM32988.1 T9SS type A sorting domain-containing protein [Spirosoma arboris]